MQLELSGEETLDAPRQQVWDALNDPDVLGRCIPGCRKVTEAGPDDYVIEVHLKVAENVTTQQDVAAWMRHVWDEHGFRSFRTVINSGWNSPLFQLRHIPGLEKSGLPPDVCCYNVQMLKPV